MSLSANLRDAVTGASAAGDLVTFLAAQAGERQADAIALALALHRDGVIDLVEALFRHWPDRTWSPDLHLRQGVLSRMIPDIDVPALRMIEALDGLQVPMLEHVLDEAFLNWCRAAPGRPDEVVGLLDGGGDVADRHVLAALIAGLQAHPTRFLELAAAMAGGEGHERKQVGVRALSQLHPVDDRSMAAALDALEAVIADVQGDGGLRALALSSVFALAARVPSASMEQFEQVLRSVPLHSVPQLANGCARALAAYATRLPDTLLGCARDGLQGMESASPGWHDVDLGLYQLLTTSGMGARALGLLEVLARRQDADVVLRRLDSAGHELSNEGGSRLDGVVTSWLLSGEPDLCRAARWLVEGVHDRERRFEVDPLRFHLDDRQASFLARKAIGWLFVRPLAVASMIVSMLDQVSDEGRSELTELLYDPLLMNYPGSTRRLLAEAGPSLSTTPQKAVQELLERHDGFQRAVEAVDCLPELQPGEASRRIEAQRQDDEFRIAREKAKERSVLQSMVHTVLLLHGSRSVSYVGRVEGEPQRLDNPLRSLSVELEHPMQAAFDPIGLEMTLLSFRHERLSP